MRAPMLMPGINALAMQPVPVEFNQRSLNYLAEVNPMLRDLMMRTEAEAERRGIDFEISEGMRDRARQEQLVAQGLSQTMNSRHLTGNAVDIHIRNPDGSANWDFEAYRPVADIFRQEAAAMGVPDAVWGGDWRTLRDGVHFQIGGTGGAPASPAEGRPTPATPSGPAPSQNQNPAPSADWRRYAQQAAGQAATSSEPEPRNALALPFAGLDPSQFMSRRRF
jgi:peptidoglycan LD-endopeptidase CwlK